MMKMNNYKYILCLTVFLLSACSKDEPLVPLTDTIEIGIGISNYTTKAGTVNTDAGTTAEQEIDNLYVFLFPTSGDQSLMRYAISAPGGFTGGSWSVAEKKVALNLTQLVAGNRNVYIVANYNAALKTELDKVTTPDDLKTKFNETATPWSPVLATPILMVGNKTHNFNDNHQLKTVDLERALAKVTLVLTLSSKYQADFLLNGNPQYLYRYVAFDTHTYVTKPTAKPNNLKTGNNTSFTEYETNPSGKVTELTLTTYLNERDDSGATIEVVLPFTGGLLPPPEFGDDVYKLALPLKIERNTWYKYDVSLGDN